MPIDDIETNIIRDIKRYQDIIPKGALVNVKVSRKTFYDLCREPELYRVSHDQSFFKGALIEIHDEIPDDEYEIVIQNNMF